MVLELGCQLRMASKTALCVYRLDPGLLCAATSTMNDMAICMAWNANCTGMLQTNMVTERTARLDAEQHVQTLTAQLQTLTRKPDNPHAQMVLGKLGKLDAQAKGGSNDREPVTLSYLGQLDRNLVNAMKNSAASETRVMNVGLNVGQEQDSNSTLHLVLTMTTTGKAFTSLATLEEVKAWRLGDGSSWSLACERNRGQLV